MTEARRQPRRPPATEWRRLQPGEDHAVDAFLQAHLAMVEARLHDARNWHANPRDYRLDPDPSRLAPADLYKLDGVAITPVTNDRNGRALAKGGGVIITVVIYVWLLWQTADLLR